MPVTSTPANTCWAAAARTASTATSTLPSVRFLKPTGIESPDASWRWIWLSVVRAPIAPQDTASEMYWGMIGSRNSQPTGRPSESTSSSSPRAMRSPVLTSPDSSRCGSLIMPFHPIVVRGFSKYTRIAMHRSSSSSPAFARSRRAYSRAASTSCTLHGPTTASSRSSRPSRIAAMLRAAAQDDLGLLGGQRQLVQHQRGRHERDDLLDALVANVLAGTGKTGSHRSVSLFGGVYVLALHGRSRARGDGARSVETSDADGLSEADRAPS